MTEQRSEPIPAVWDPTAAGGAGGWVRPARPGAGTAAEPEQSTARRPSPPAAPPLPPPPVPGHRPMPAAPPAPEYHPAPPASVPPPPATAPAPPARPPGDTPGPRPGSRRNPLLIGAGLLLAVGVGAGGVLALQHGSGTAGSARPPLNAAPPPTVASPPATTGATSGGAGTTPSPSAVPSGGAPGPNAQAEAQALNDLLTGAAPPTSISNTVAQVASCPAKPIIDGDVQVFTSDVTRLAPLLGKLSKLDLNDLPGGAAAAQYLSTAWQQAGDADTSYASWARSVSGCSGMAPTTTDKQNADTSSELATQNKQQFVTWWGQLAPTYGLQSPSTDRI
ncbi:hypothetical protein ACIGXM_31490 [Kitasatospora sp. NPDC052896]|uniref:hypothetical protein n=1 Tax=Kitasatospora sp. NPDC052896 TaxID=3364061 RepID=UPI0037C7946E